VAEQLPVCAACAEKRLHTPEEWKNHPYAGHGYTPEQGWTHPALKAEADASAKAAAERPRSADAEPGRGVAKP
jgi:hypothetical protein